MTQQLKIYQIKSNQIYILVAEKATHNIHIKIWHFATEGMDGQTSWD